jgi:metal-responsive CopG/Arc/MetJ family transcriptional regulator
MAVETVAVNLSRELLDEVDAVVGQDRRSEFLEETARAELRKRKLLEFL